MNSDEERNLKLEIFDFINDSIKSLFLRQKIKYIDHYFAKTTADVYTVMSTRDMTKYAKDMALIYEIYAFTLTKDENIFSTYDYEVFDFENSNQSIKVYKIKI